MDKTIQLLAQTQGIDKAYRLLVYGLLLIDRPSTATSPSFLARLQRLRPVLNETRVVLRLFGLLPIVRALMKMNEAENSSRDKKKEKTKKEEADQNWIQSLQKVQLLSMLVYYPCEHIYWLGAHQVLLLKPGQGDAWSRWSCRAWALYLVLDLYIEYLERQKQQDKKSESLLSALSSWSVINTLADLPLAIHWSLASYPLSNKAVAVLGLISTVAGIQLRWKSLA